MLRLPASSQGLSRRDRTQPLELPSSATLKQLQALPTEGKQREKKKKKKFHFLGLSANTTHRSHLEAAETRNEAAAWGESQRKPWADPPFPALPTGEIHPKAFRGLNFTAEGTRRVGFALSQGQFQLKDLHPPRFTRETPKKHKPQNSGSNPKSQGLIHLERNEDPALEQF